MPLAKKNLNNLHAHLLQQSHKNGNPTVNIERSNRLLVNRQLELKKVGYRTFSVF